MNRFNNFTNKFKDAKKEWKKKSERPLFGYELIETYLPRFHVLPNTWNLEGLNKRPIVMVRLTWGATLYMLRTSHWNEIKDRENFWVEKAIETRERYEETSQRRGVNEDYKMISESSIPEKSKRRLLSVIEQFEKNRENNMKILSGPFVGH